jgi:hypothetical protein
MNAALLIPTAEIMLNNEIGDCVGCGGSVVGEGNVVRVGCGIGERVPETPELLPAITFTKDCQSWYPFNLRMMVWLPCAIFTRVSGVSPRYALSR